MATATATMKPYDWQAAEREVSEKAAKIVAESRAEFFAPSTTNAQRTERILRDIRCVFGPAAGGSGSGSGSGGLWPVRRVLRSPFMFLEDPAAEGFGLGLALDAEAEEALRAFREELQAATAAAAETEKWSSMSFRHRGRSVATCAAMNVRENWIAGSAAMPALLFCTPILSHEPRARVASGMHSAEEMDALHAQITELYSFEQFWTYFEPFEMVENLPDEAILRAHSYLSPRCVAVDVRKALYAGRTETVKKLVRMPGIAAKEREDIARYFLSAVSTRIMESARDAVKDVADPGNARAEFLERMRPHYSLVDVGFQFLLPELDVPAEMRAIHAKLLFVNYVGLGCSAAGAGPFDAKRLLFTSRALTEPETAAQAALHALGWSIYEEFAAEIAAASGCAAFSAAEKLFLRAAEKTRS